MARKTYNQKLHSPGDLPKVEEMLDARQIARYGPGKMLIAAPLDYDALMKRVPEGKLTTLGRMRAHLAKLHGADVTCPLTAGIFINICAGASEERHGEDVTPYWRTLRSNGELNEKYPGGLELHRQQLISEGHGLLQKGKRWFVKDYEQKLYDF